MQQLKRDIKNICDILGYSNTNFQRLTAGKGEYELEDIRTNLYYKLSEADSTGVIPEWDKGAYLDDDGPNMRQTNIVKGLGTVWDYHEKGNYICIPIFGTYGNADNHILKGGEAIYPGLIDCLLGYERQYGVRSFALWAQRIITLPVGQLDILDFNKIEDSCKQANEIAEKKDIKDIQTAVVGPSGIFEVMKICFGNRFSALGPTKQARRIARVKSQGATLIFTTGSEDGILCPKCSRIFRVQSDADINKCSLCGNAMISSNEYKMPPQNNLVGPAGGGTRMALKDIAYSIKCRGGIFLGTVEGEEYRNNKTILGVKCRACGEIFPITWLRLNKNAWCPNKCG